jgi:hypothetical protein
MKTTTEKANSSRGEFHAVLRRTAGGLYQAQYSAEFNPENPDARELPDFHLSSTMADAQVWVEQMALGMGYSRVIWDSLPDA